MLARFIAHLRIALPIGVVGGLIVGLCEGLVVLSRNSFVQPDQYWAVYVAVPTLSWFVMGIVMVSLMTAIVTLATRQTPKGAAPAYAAAVGFAGSAAIAAPWIGEISSTLAQVGFTFTFTSRLFLVATLLLLVGTMTVLALGAAARWRDALESRLPKTTIIVGLLVLPLLIWPITNFLATDWRTTPPPKGTSRDPGQPNLLLISIDTLRADHLGSYGSPHGLTPNLDRLAAEGVVFTQAITTSPWTLPAIASLHTGLLPRIHGAGRTTNRRDPLGRSPLPDGTWTLARALRDSSYRTAAIVTNPYLALSYGLGQGFDEYYNITIESEAFLAFEHTTALRLATSFVPDLIVGDRGETVSARAVDWLSLAPRPFFLWLHYIDPHPPYSAPGATHHKSFRGDSLFGGANKDHSATGLTSPEIARLRSGELRLDEQQKEAVRNLYRAEVASVDTAVGRVLDAISALGLDEHTLIVVVADHGEEFWEHCRVEHGHSAYEELVPLILKEVQSSHAGSRQDALVSVVDVAPTVLRLLGVPLPTQLKHDHNPLLALGTDGRHKPRDYAIVENMLFSEECTGFELQPSSTFVGSMDDMNHTTLSQTRPSTSMSLPTGNHLVGSSWKQKRCQHQDPRSNIPKPPTPCACWDTADSRNISVRSALAASFFFGPRAVAPQTPLSSICRLPGRTLGLLRRPWLA
jgi:arylsulfatase A-like enzyme